MMLTFRPIQNWPDGWQDPKERPNTPFRASYDATLKLLDDELYALGATEAWVQLDVRTGQLRARQSSDAWRLHPAPGRRPMQPGLRVMLAVMLGWAIAAPCYELGQQLGRIVFGGPHA